MTAVRRQVDPWERIAELEEELAYYKRELKVTIETRRLAAVQEAFRLTRFEARMLIVLQGGARSKASLHMAIYGDREAVTDLKIVDVYVCKARRKLGFDAIKTLHGFGYALGPAFAEQLVALSRREAA